MIKKIKYKQTVETLVPINSLDELSLGDKVEVIDSSSTPVRNGDRFIIDNLSGRRLHATRGPSGIGIPEESVNRMLAKVVIEYTYYDKEF